MIKAILIDDEERGNDALSQLIINYCPEISIVGVATDILAAADMVRQQQPDVIFLDVEMPGGNGFQLLEQFENIDFEIIFVTAYNEYAIKALRFSALDYLLKPVNIKELQEAVKRLSLKLKQQTGNKHLQYFKDALASNAPFNKIVLSDMVGYHFVNIADIIYCEASESYTHFFLGGQVKHTVSRPLKDFEDLFSRHNFFRIHKSFLVNLDQVASVNKDFLVIMNDKSELPLSVRKRTEFFSLLRELHSM